MRRKLFNNQDHSGTEERTRKLSITKNTTETLKRSKKTIRRKNLFNTQNPARRDAITDISRNSPPDQDPPATETQRNAIQNQQNNQLNQ